MPVDTLNYLVGVGTIGLQIVTAGLVFAFLLRKRVSVFAEVLRPFEQWGVHIAFAASLLASAVSLFYSNVIGYPPCDLCWWQRIFMYPQTIILGMSLWSRDAQATLYALIFSTIGLLIGVYNHILQMYPSGGLPCPAQGVSCSQIFYLEFGYITFPMLSITFFAFLIVLMLIVRRRSL